MNKYLKNAYVVLGLVGLGYYVYRRKQILKISPKKANRSVKELEEEKKNDIKVGQKLANDVADMSIKEL